MQESYKNSIKNTYNYCIQIYPLLSVSLHLLYLYYLLFIYIFSEPLEYKLHTTWHFILNIQCGFFFFLQRVQQSQCVFSKY